MAKKLNRKQSRFVHEYVKDLNATRAAIRAGYSERSARNQANRMMTNDDILQAIEEREVEIIKAAKIKAIQIRLEEKCIAFANIGDFFTKDGNLLMPHELPEHASRALASFKVRKLPGGGISYEYRLNDKGRALERLSRQLGLYNDKLKMGVSLEDLLRGLPEPFASELRKELARRLSK